MRRGQKSLNGSKFGDFKVRFPNDKHGSGRVKGTSHLLSVPIKIYLNLRWLVPLTIPLPCLPHPKTFILPQATCTYTDFHIPSGNIQLYITNAMYFQAPCTYRLLYPYTDTTRTYRLMYAFRHHAHTDFHISIGIIHLQTSLLLQAPCIYRIPYPFRQFAHQYRLPYPYRHHAHTNYDIHTDFHIPTDTMCLQSFISFRATYTVLYRLPYPYRHHAHTDFHIPTGTMHLQTSIFLQAPCTYRLPYSYRYHAHADFHIPTGTMHLQTSISI